MPPFASGAAVGTMQSGSFQSHDPSHGLPCETPGGGGVSARLPPLAAGIGSNRSTGALSAASSAASAAAASAPAPVDMPHSLPKPQAGQLLGPNRPTTALLPDLKQSVEGKLPGRAPAGLPRSPARGSGNSPVLQLNLREAVVEAHSKPGMLPDAQAVKMQQDALSTGSAALAAPSMSASASAAAVQIMRTAGSAMSDHSSRDGAGAAKALAAVQQSKHSSYSRSRSVSFEPADAAAMRGAADSDSVRLGVEPAVQQHSNVAQASRAQKQMFHPVRSYDERVQTGGTDNQTELSTAKGSRRLVSMGSSLTAAVSETMQDRMLAGGMMHKQVDNTSADRCVWPRSILKLQGAEQLPSVPTSRLSKTASIVEPPKEGVSGVRQDAEGNRSMPAQLARHQSSLNQVSRRPDFAAAMDAVRASWREEEIGKNAACSAVQARELVPDSIHNDEQLSLDTIWASIRHAT